MGDVPLYAEFQPLSAPRGPMGLITSKGVCLQISSARTRNIAGLFCGHLGAKGT